jgi:hypothetical protein
VRAGGSEAIRRGGEIETMGRGHDRTEAIGPGGYG